MEPRKIRGVADARACLAAVEASGQSRVAWAKAHGVNPRSLNAWRLNLSRAQRGRTTPVIRLVELVPATPSTPTVYRVRCGAFEVEVDGVIEADRLGQLLRVMVAAC